MLTLTNGLEEVSLVPSGFPLWSLALYSRTQQLGYNLARFCHFVRLSTLPSQQHFSIVQPPIQFTLNNSLRGDLTIKFAVRHQPSHSKIIAVGKPCLQRSLIVENCATLRIRITCAVRLRMIRALLCHSWAVQTLLVSEAECTISIGTVVK